MLDLADLKLDCSVYENTKFFMKGLIGLSAISEDEEKEIILAILNNNHTLEVSIKEITCLD